MSRNIENKGIIYPEFVIYILFNTSFVHEILERKFKSIILYIQCMTD